MKNIVVPTDFSAASKNATDYAASLARDFGAKIILINVLVPPIIIAETSASAFLMSEAEIFGNEKKLLTKEMSRISEKYQVETEGFIREGAALDVILQFSWERKVDLIVMGMKGKGKSNSIFGSTTTTVIRKAKVPVFVIPERICFSPACNITYASEFVMDREGHQMLEELSERYDSNIRVLNVQKNTELMAVENAIGKVEADLSFVKVPHSFNTIESDRIENGINDFLNENPSDLLVMVAQKHSILKRYFGTLHTKNMCYQTKNPLLVLNPSR